MQALRELQVALSRYLDLYSQLIIEHAIQQLTAGIGWLESAIAQIQEAAVTAPHRLLAGTAARETLARLAGLSVEKLTPVVAPCETMFSHSAARGYDAMREAEAGYRQAVGEAGRMYEASLRTSEGDAAATARAHQMYADQVADAWRTYSAIIEATKQETHAAFAGTAQALEQAIAQAGGAESKPELEEV